MLTCTLEATEKMMTIYPSRNCAKANLALWQSDFEITTCDWDVCTHDEQSGGRDYCYCL